VLHVLTDSTDSEIAEMIALAITSRFFSPAFFVEGNEKKKRENSEEKVKKERDRGCLLLRLTTILRFTKNMCQKMKLTSIDIA
jgi:regulator of PEP synthase PpsR (kinase-PPPase family)